MNLRVDAEGHAAVLEPKNEIAKRPLCRAIPALP